MCGVLLSVSDVDTADWHKAQNVWEWLRLDSGYGVERMAQVIVGVWVWGFLQPPQPAE